MGGGIKQPPINLGHANFLAEKLKTEFGENVDTIH